ncbi:MAG: hypothetical protein EZS28_007871 [Streblomastix strix]|uniref:Uncharacterized protein n=1 Tax=Streblomastix strix TaxID=222440 RepID=A0A5J4WPI8_9EUKA|nr:MAG: hypothetical protein EZS28_007871 [Streblomastix strix]
MLKLMFEIMIQLLILKLEHQVFREIERYIDEKYDFEGQQIGKVKLSILYEADDDEKEKQRQEEEEKNKIREKKGELKRQQIEKDKEEEIGRAKEVEREAIERAQQQRRAVQPMKEERQESLNIPQQRNIRSVNIYRANANIGPIRSQSSLTPLEKNLQSDDESSYKPNEQKQRNVKNYLHTSPSQTRIKQGKDLVPQFTPNQQQQQNSPLKAYRGQENTKEKERDRLYTDYNDDKRFAEKERLEKLKSLEDKGYVYKHVKSHILDVLNKCLQEQVDPKKLAVFAPNLTVLKDNANKLLDEENQIAQEEAEQQLRSLKQFAKEQAQREGKGPEREKEIMQEEQLGGIVTRASMILAYLKDRGIDIDPKDKDKINDQLKGKEKESQNNIPSPLQLSTVSEPNSIPSSFRDRNIAVDEDKDSKEKQKQREKDKDDLMKQLKDQIDKKQQEKRNLEQDLDDIKNQLQQKDKQIQQLKDKIRDKDNEIDKDEIQLFDLKKQLNNKKKEIDDLRKQLDDEKQKSGQDGQRSKQKERERQQLIRDNEEAQRAKDRFEKKLRDQEEQQRKAEDDRRKAQQEKDRIENILKDQKNEKQRVLQEKQKGSDQSRKEEEATGRSEDELDRTDDKIKDLERKLIQKDAEHEDLKKQLIKDNDNLQQKQNEFVKEIDGLNEKERELARQRKQTQDPDIKSITLQPEDKEKGSIFELTNQLGCGQDKNKDQLPATKELFNKIADNIYVRDQIERSELLNVLADHTRAEQAPDPLFVYSSGILNHCALSDVVEDEKPKRLNQIIINKPNKPVKLQINLLKILNLPKIAWLVMMILQTIEQILVSNIIPTNLTITYLGEEDEQPYKPRTLQSDDTPQYLASNVQYPTTSTHIPIHPSDSNQSLTQSQPIYQPVQSQQPYSSTSSDPNTNQIVNSLQTPGPIISPERQQSQERIGDLTLRKRNKDLNELERKRLKDLAALEAQGEFRKLVKEKAEKGELPKDELTLKKLKELAAEEDLYGIAVRAMMILAYLKDKGIDVDSPAIQQQTKYLECQQQKKPFIINEVESYKNVKVYGEIQPDIDNKDKDKSKAEEQRKNKEEKSEPESKQIGKDLDPNKEKGYDRPDYDRNKNKERREAEGQDQDKDQQTGPEDKNNDQGKAGSKLTGRISEAIDGSEIDLDGNEDVGEQQYQDEDQNKSKEKPQYNYKEKVVDAIVGQDIDIDQEQNKDDKNQKDQNKSKGRSSYKLASRMSAPIEGQEIDPDNENYGEEEQQDYEADDKKMNKYGDLPTEQTDGNSNKPQNKDQARVISRAKAKSRCRSGLSAKPFDKDGTSDNKQPQDKYSGKEKDTLIPGSEDKDKNDPNDNKDAHKNIEQGKMDLKKVINLKIQIKHKIKLEMKGVHVIKTETQQEFKIKIIINPKTALESKILKMELNQKIKKKIPEELKVDLNIKTVLQAEIDHKMEIEILVYK